MKKMMSFFVLGVLGLMAYQRAHHRAVSAPLLTEDAPEQTPREEARLADPQVALPPEAQFHCDGRVYCSQMSSCEEAKFFLQHCPDVKMDGDNDGVPCEKQWCGGG